MPTSPDHAPLTTHGSDRRRVAIVFRVALVVQLLAVLVAVFGDIGFDKPGRFGLARLIGDGRRGEG